MDIKSIYGIFMKNGLVSTDTRNILHGSIYFALKGDNFNGNQFAGDAIEKGASAVVVDEDIPCHDVKVIRVNNVLETLQQLAAYHRIQSRVRILAITGSNGKTTTKELCYAVLSKKFRVHATQGNLNNHIGVPLTLLSMKSDIEIGIIEMGANHPGEISLLCNIAMPDFGIITNIGKAHLEGFGGIQGVAQAKSELFRHLMSHGKTLFLNEGSSYLAPHVPLNYDKVIRYNGEHSLRLVDYTCDPLLSLKAEDGEIKFNIATRLAGSYNAENILAACSVGLRFGVGIHDIEDAIQSYQPRNNRSQLIKTLRNTVLMDAYNANPSSMTAAIHEFLNFDGHKKLLILGEMREVGNTSDNEHEEIVMLLKSRQVDQVICVGKAFEKPSLKAGYKYVPSVDELNQLLAEEPLNGYFVFVKGSRSNHLEKVIPLL